MFKISSGKMQKPIKAVIYGPEGIGKSSFAAQAPGALFIDTEGSTVHMDVRRLPTPQSWIMIMQEVDYVRRTPGLCQTLVIDTADWAERMCVSSVCAKFNKQGLEDFGYGKGNVYVYEDFGRLLNQLNGVIDAGMNVIITAHGMVRKFEQPDEMGAYDRWALKLIDSPKCSISAMLKEWADVVLFANYETYTVKNDEKKNKAQGGARVMHTTHHPCWDAKNRHGLPDKLPLDFDQIAHLFVTQQAAPAPAAAPDPEPEIPFTMSDEPETAAPPPQQSTGIPPALQQLMDAAGVTEKQISNAVAARGYYPAGMKIKDYDPNFVQGCLVGAWDSVLEMIKKS